MLNRIDWREPGLPLSIALHLLCAMWGLFAFSQPAPFDAAQESVPVEVVSDVSEITKGIKSAEKVIPNAPERVDKVADLRKENDPGAAKTDTASLKPPSKQEETVKEDPAKAEPPQPAPIPTPPARPAPAQAAAPPATPPPQPAQSQPQKSAATKDDPVDNRDAEIIREQQKKEQQKAEEARKLAEQKKKEEQKKLADQAAAKAKAEEQRKLAALQKQQEAKALAEKIAAEEAKAKAEHDAKVKAEKLAEAKKAAAAKAKAVAEAKKAAEERKRQEAERKEASFDPNAIRRRLMASHEQPTSSGSTGAQVSRTASLGTRAGTGAKLSPSDREALVGMLQDQIQRCWNLTVTTAPAVKPIVQVQLSPDGAITGGPVLTNSSADPNFRAVAESGMRAIRQCAPYRIPAKFAQYFQDWKTLNVRLDPSDLL